MSRSSPPMKNAQNAQHPAPFAIKRRRTILACSNCRKRKIRCITTEQPPNNPCARCTKRNIECEYVATTDPDKYSNYPPAPDIRTASPAPIAMRWAPPLTRARGTTAPPLPYTGPPPSSRRSLALAGYSTPSLPGATLRFHPPYPAQSPSFPPSASNHGSPNSSSDSMSPSPSTEYWNPPPQMSTHPAYCDALAQDPSYQPCAVQDPRYDYDLHAAHAYQYLHPHPLQPAQNSSATYAADYDGMLQWGESGIAPEDAWYYHDPSRG
ncbi:hypothetical protein DFH09DRAFT_1478702 [Mycena vulgaris]|nr:hypothetical protein DFH09DRAFT_1478702 [Mycena vulgaris]